MYESESLRESYMQMNGFIKFCKLLVIKEKDLFVLSGDIDTYIYMLFLKYIIYLVAGLCVINMPILIHLYMTGDIATLCNQPSNSTANGTALIYMS